MRRRAIPVAMLGGLVPDVDTLLIPVGWDVYLRGHEIGTHSILGTVPIAAAATVLIRPFSRGSSWADSMAMAWLGCLSHVALDVFSGARIQLGWPVVPGRVSVPLVAMADPWLVAIFVVGAVALVLSTNRSRQTAFGIAIAVVCFLSLKSVVLSRTPLAGTHDGGPVLARVVEAQWASLSRWNVFDRGSGELTHWIVEPGQPPTRLLAWPTAAAESSLISASRSLQVVRNFLHVHELGFAVEQSHPVDGTRVLWSDLRFCRAPQSPAEIVFDPVITATAPGGPVQIACSLWVGGAFDREGRATRQFVKIGGWWQTRAAGP